MKKIFLRPPYQKALGFALALLLLLFATYVLTPKVVFDVPYSRIIFDRNGRLLNVSLADDEQWRFPAAKKMSGKFARAIVLQEDKRFYLHPGVDVLAIARAIMSNLRAGRIVSGASTIPMQVVRLSRGNPRRSWGEKTLEALMALKLCQSQTRAEVLQLYAAHAPFGGNVVGLEAASWRYFRRPSQDLSWAEAATLAVLPNSPGLIHPGRRRQSLRHKRDQLLGKLLQQSWIDPATYKLALQETLPTIVHQVPHLAPHLDMQLGRRGRVAHSNIDAELQARVEQVIGRQHQIQAANGVHNMAALILDLPSGEVLAYIGNISDFNDRQHGNFVDVLRAPRSTGSLLKPFLYASMLDSGEILPEELVPDIPTSISGFSPENYSRHYDGAVSAAEALSRSLNVPTVRMLRNFGVNRFYARLKAFGMTTLNRKADNYGLTLILGGAEGSLWDLVGMYAGLARSALEQKPAFFAPRLWRDQAHKITKTRAPNNAHLGAAAAYLTLQAMLEVKRPGVQNVWRNFASARRVAWKTGTSYGFRDAWAIGVTPQYAVGVWVGNADGEGRPGLVGYKAAAPVLFELFDLLPHETWFERPDKGLRQIEVCAHSGMRAGPNCVDLKTEWVPLAGLRRPACTYCQLLHCDAGCRHQVNADCQPLDKIERQSRFVLPAGMAWYYRRRHADYRRLPPTRADCSRDDKLSSAPMSCLYPRQGASIYVPIELNGRRGRVVLRAAHRDSKAHIYWHLDDRYLGETRQFHEMPVQPEPGEHLLTLVDDKGFELQRRFSVINPKK